jgi:hypothetical protein
MVVGFTTTYAISAYNHKRCEFESRSGKMYSIQHYVIKFVRDLQTGWWFSLGPLVSSTNKTDRHDITEILLTVALNTITLPLTSESQKKGYHTSSKIIFYEYTKNNYIGNKIIIHSR